MTLTTHVKALTVALAIALATSLLILVGPLAKPANTQTVAPPTLTGETLTAVEPPSPQDLPEPISVTANCNPSGTSTIEYEATGTAVGPYPGTFTESGTFTLGPPGGGNPLGTRLVESFSAEFEIDSAVGRVTGTKSAEDLLIIGSGVCGQVSTSMGDFFRAIATASARYEATIETASGTFADRGTTQVTVQDIEDRLSGSAQFRELFRESFVSDLTEPEPLLPTTKEQCKDGGYERFGFENQGDCVSFVATGGKNEPGKNQ
jgi:hypothetical protein